ncbi:MAG: SDR family oxidoreductase [Chloroflexi bacterium]|nr:SDR family oxidoreductase [Chloroflexota bacterium]
MDLKDISRGYDFTGRTAAITGGAGLIGGEIARALGSCGANVAILDRDPERADRLIDMLGCDPNCSAIVFADVLKRDTLVRAEAVIRERLGPVDILINAAGGNAARATTRPEQSLFDLDEAAIRETIELNTMGTIEPCRVFGKGMAERGEGVILNISSMTALRPLSRVVAYSAAKAAISNFTQWLAVHMAQEYSPQIRVNAIAPGFLIGKQNRDLLLNPDGSLTPRGQTIIDQTPLGRFGEPEELLGAVLWLLSPLSGFVTGAVVPLDGGFSAYSGV